MNPQRRRVIYMDDATWAVARTKSASSDQTISDYLRDLVQHGTFVVTPEEHRTIPATPPKVKHGRQVRDL